MSRRPQAVADQTGHVALGSATHGVEAGRRITAADAKTGSGD